MTMYREILRLAEEGKMSPDFSTFSQLNKR